MVLSLSDSLSGVVGLLARGAPLPKGPYVIVSCTKFATPEEAIERYSQSYWKSFDPKVLLGILTEIWPHVIQPRLMPYFEDHYQHRSNGGEWQGLQSGKASEVWITLESSVAGEGHYSTWHAQLQLEAAVMMRADGGLWYP